MGRTTVATATNGSKPTNLTRWGFVSIGAAIVTLLFKFGAYRVTGSVGLLSDAVESMVNVVAALTALFALWYGTRPVDRNHPYGHEKIEFFASAVEGGLILFAAFSIMYYSGQRLLHPQPVESLDIGILITVIAAAINFAVARLLLRVAEQHHSVVLEADGKHLMTDVVTSLAVAVGLLVAWATGIERLDPLIGLLVAINIVRTGVDLLRVAFHGLMDRALPEEEEEQARAAIAAALPDGVSYHALRTRRAGSRRFVDLHLQVPGEMTVLASHDVAAVVEDAVAAALVNAETTVHIEPREDPRAWTDSDLVPIEQKELGLEVPSI